LPAPYAEKSAPYDSKRSGLAPGPWNPLALTTPFFQRAKVLPFFNFNPAAGEIKFGNELKMVNGQLSMFNDQC